MRSWGDRETEFGSRDVRVLSWNGRMPEVTAAIALEQLRGYPQRLEKIQKRVSKFRELVKDITDFQITPTLNQVELAYTQLSLKINPTSRFTKKEILELASEASIPMFHSNFEPLTELSLFRSGDWLSWVTTKSDIKNSIPSDFPGAYEVYEHLGIGLLRSNFESELKFRHLCEFVKIHFK
jgi:dTDP-4-amino-4,6-dideoxygalactose transaminase